VEIPVYRRDVQIPLPYKHIEQDSGYDLTACIEGPIVLVPFVPVKIPTGIHLGMSPGIEAQIRPRSSLSAKGILVSLGTIDAPFRGELAAILLNLTHTRQVVSPGQRVAQLCFVEVLSPKLVEVNSLEALGTTERGAGGWGSTGA